MTFILNITKINQLLIISLLMDKSSENYKAAKKQVEDKKGLVVHAMIYFVVNTGLFLLDLILGDGWWFYWVAIGWGIGVAIHIIVFIIESMIFSPQWEEKEIKKIMGGKK